MISDVKITDHEISFRVYGLAFREVLHPWEEMRFELHPDRINMINFGKKLKEMGEVVVRIAMHSDKSGKMPANAFGVEEPYIGFDVMGKLLEIE